MIKVLGRSLLEDARQRSRGDVDPGRARACTCRRHSRSHSRRVLGLDGTVASIKQALDRGKVLRRVDHGVSEGGKGWGWRAPELKVHVAGVGV